MTLSNEPKGDAWTPYARGVDKKLKRLRDRVREGGPRAAFARKPRMNDIMFGAAAPAEEVL